MGFILLGLMTLNQLGLAGAVLQMISHGLLAGLLFAIVGRMVYARTHTREFSTLGPFNLSRTLPFAAVTFVLAGMAAMGLPGFSGFVAELMILIGTWRSYPLFALATGFGILIGVIYIWRAMQKAFFTGRPSIHQSGCPIHDSLIVMCGVRCTNNAPLNSPPSPSPKDSEQSSSSPRASP